MSEQYTVVEIAAMSDQRLRLILAKSLGWSEMVGKYYDVEGVCPGRNRLSIRGMVPHWTTTSDDALELAGKSEFVSDWKFNGLESDFEVEDGMATVVWIAAFYNSLDDRFVEVRHKSPARAICEACLQWKQEPTE